jgi:hypothetical protein
MGFITSYLLGGVAAVAAWSMVAPADSSGALPNIASAFQSSGAAGSTATTINRAAKGDRLAAPVSQAEKKQVASIEVVGVNDAAIIYRDRDGNILYRTDPLTNTTVVAKGVKLPDITVRQDAGSSTTSVPVNVPVKASGQQDMPIGCEPAASPIASPRLSHLTGHCISQAEPITMLAAMN